MTSTVPKEYHIVYLKTGFAMEAMNAVIVAMKKLTCAVKNRNQRFNNFDLIFLVVTNHLFQRIGHVVKDNLRAGKLIPNALRIHKSAMDTKIALTEAMRVKAYAVRISGSLFINQHSYRSPLLVRLLQSPDVQIQRYRISKGPQILPKLH